jgi:predicted dehydrogenase
MINVAIIGSGSIARMHIEGCFAFPERCNIVALCDIEYETLVKTKENFAFKDDVRLFSSYTEMIEEMHSRIEVLSICTPPILSLKKVISSGRAGKVLHAQVDSFWWLYG